MQIFYMYTVIEHVKYLYFCFETRHLYSNTRCKNLGTWYKCFLLHDKLLSCKKWFNGSSWTYKFLVLYSKISTCFLVFLEQHASTEWQNGWNNVIIKYIYRTYSYMCITFHLFPVFHSCYTRIHMHTHPFTYTCLFCSLIIKSWTMIVVHNRDRPEIL